MQPLGPLRICVAIGDEGAVFEGELGHGLIDPDPLSQMALRDALSAEAKPAATNKSVMVLRAGVSSRFLHPTSIELLLRF